MLKKELPFVLLKTWLQLANDSTLPPEANQRVRNAMLRQFNSLSDAEHYYFAVKSQQR